MPFPSPLHFWRRAVACLLVWAWATAWSGLTWAAHGPITAPVTLPSDRATVLDQAWVLPGQGPLQPPDDHAAWVPQRLPHQWKQTHGNWQGSMWYRFRVTLPGVPSQDWGVYLPKVVTNGQVWVNGVALGAEGSMNAPVTNNWYTPLLFSVPTKLWQAGENTIDVCVVSGHAARDGLAPIEVGPRAALYGAYRWRHALQVDAVEVIHVALITIGLLMSVVWLRDRSQMAFGYMGMAALFWGVSTLMLLAPTPLTRPALWDAMAGTATHWYQLALCAFFFRFAKVRSAWLNRLFAALALAVPLYHGALSDHLSPMWVFAGIYALALVGMATAIAHVLRHKRPDGIWLVLGCALVVPSAGHDVMVVTQALPFDSVYWLGLLGPALIAFSFVILAGDYARSRAALYDLNRNLASMVADREQALRASFERLAAMESAQAVSAERSRILKDMHDGVGAHLSSALRQLQATPGKPVDVPLVTQTLRDSLDQLKLSIDAMSLQTGDVVGLLASWRFRLTPRLKAAGLELVWDVDALPPWPRGHAPVMRHLQYILLEGLSNVLQHSGATRLVLSAHRQGEALLVSLSDNGRGWSAQPNLCGQGLQTMHGRASQIGAELRFLTPETGGLALLINLPWQDEAAPGASAGLSSAA